MSDDDHEIDEQTLREGDEALIEVIGEIADADVGRETEIAARVKHCLAVLHLAGVPLDCTIGSALQRLGETMQSAIHKALSEEP